MINLFSSEIFATSLKLNQEFFLLPSLFVSVSVSVSLFSPPPPSFLPHSLVHNYSYHIRQLKYTIKCHFLVWPYTVKHCAINPLHPNISMHILHTDLYTLPKLLTRRIHLTIKSFFSWWSFPLFLWHSFLIQGWYCTEKLEARDS